MPSWDGADRGADGEDGDDAAPDWLGRLQAGNLSSEVRYTLSIAAAVALLACTGCVVCTCFRRAARQRKQRWASRYAPDLPGMHPRPMAWGHGRGVRAVRASDGDGEEEESDEDEYLRVAHERDIAFDEEFKAERLAADAEDLEACLGVASLPTIYKTSEGASTVELPLAGLRAISALVEGIAHVGQAMIDADISVDTVKVHYALGQGERPRKITASTTPLDLKKATAFIVTPAV